MDVFLHDLKFGFRSLVRTPGLTVIAICALALGIAINTAIFTVVHAVLIQPLPYANPDSLYIMWEKQPQMESSVSYPNYQDWRENQVFESMAAFRKTSMNLTGGGEPERLSVRMLSADFLRRLGATPALGRDFTSAQDKPESEAVVILSHGLWQRRFASSPTIVGRSILLNDAAYTVAGVLPRDFEFGSGADVFVPIGHF